MKESYNLRFKFKKPMPTIALSIALLVLCVFITTESGFGAIAPHIGEIRITPEGNVEGTDKIIRTDNVYTLIEDLYSSGTIHGLTFISIEKDGVTLDGAGKTIQGTSTGVGITAHGRKDVTIKNLNIINFGTGIELRVMDHESNSTASNNRITKNNFDNSYWGIDLQTINGYVSDNTILSKNGIYGVNFQANNTVFSNNAFTNGGIVMFNSGSGNLFSGNTINDKPLVYLERQVNRDINGANQVLLVDCNNIKIQNIDNIVKLRETIQLFGTNNTRLTNCKGNIALTNSHSNIIIDNELSERGSMVTYDSAVIKLTSSNNNTIKQNLISAGASNGIILTGSSYNIIEKNQIVSSGADRAGIKIETSPGFKAEYNYIYENSITTKHYGLYFIKGASNNFVYSNSITECKNAVLLSSAYKNSFIGNNITRSTQYAISLGISDYNNFYHNNFLDNIKQAYEAHQLYMYAENNTYYSEYNTWDNGKEGNYWSDYTGTDINRDGIGETPYTVYENYTDQYPLTAPYNINNVMVNHEKWNPTQNPTMMNPTDLPKIIILSPKNTTYKLVSVPLEVTTSLQIKGLTYSIDSQPNTPISGNTTLTGLSQGTHSLTVYGNTTGGLVVSSETVYFNINTAESFPLVPIAAFSIATFIAVSLGLGLYFRKRKQELQQTF